jgi:hypothetical protein
MLVHRDWDDDTDIPSISIFNVDVGRKRCVHNLVHGDSSRFRVGIAGDAEGLPIVDPVKARFFLASGADVR